MEEFIKGCFEKEVNYVWDKYLDRKIATTSSFKEDKELETKICSATFKGKEYTMYKYFNGITLIPSGLTDLSDDFDSIIQYGQNEKGFGMSICKRNAGKVEMINHSFIISENKNERIRITSHFINYGDENNELQKLFLEENVPLELFIARNKHHNSPNRTDRFTVNIVRDEESTRWNSGVFDMDTMSVEKVAQFFSYPCETSDITTPMIKLAEEINQKYQERRTAKVAKKA